MMESALMVDFGASRIKAALWSPKTRRIIARADRAAPLGRLDPQGRFEIDPERYWELLNACVQDLRTEAPDSRFESMWICTEMHGFLLDDGRGNPLTGYISWRDQRVGRMPEGLSGLFGRLPPDTADRFRSITGMRVRSGLPWVVLTGMRMTGECPAGRVRLLTLADWILVRGGCREPRSHPTLAAGTGFYDLSGSCWSREMQELSGVPPAALRFPELAPDVELGRIELGGERLSVYGGFGDLQAALAGSGFPEQESAVVNLGTGSQVACLGEDEPGAVFEMRRSIGGTLFRAITHIPSGRAIAVVADIVDSCSRKGGGRPVFWELWQGLRSEAVRKASLAVDLNLFEAAWQYQGAASGWLRLREGYRYPDDMIAAVARAWAEQYAKALGLLGYRRGGRVVLAGGLAGKSPFLREFFGEECGFEVSFSPSSEDETLLGLIRCCEKQLGILHCVSADCDTGIASGRDGC